MYQNEYNKSLEYVKTALECAKDFENIKRCEENVENFSREKAWQCLQDMIRNYWVEIEVIGVPLHNITIYKNVDPKTISDDEMKCQLTYIAKNIPLYIWVRKGEKELAKKICKWLFENR